MNWIEAVHGSERVLAVFDGAAPPLSRVELHSVTLGHRGDAALVFDLGDYPNRPPAKWAAQGFNTAQLTLACTRVRDIRLTGWASQITAEIAVDRIADRVSVLVHSNAMSLALSADIVSVAEIAGYLNDPGTACL